MSNQPLSGSLWKRGGLRKNWKERHFVLDNASLSYFETEKAAKPKGSIAVSAITGVDRSNNAAVKLDKKLSGVMFEVRTAPRVYFMVAPDDKVDEWIAAIRSWLTPASPRSAAAAAATAAASSPPIVAEATDAAAAAAPAAAAAAAAPAATAAPAVTAEASAKKAPPPTPGAKPAVALLSVPAASLAVPSESSAEKRSPGSSPRTLNRSPRVSRDLSKSAQLIMEQEAAAAAAAAEATAAAAAAAAAPPAISFPSYEPDGMELALQSIEAFVKQSGFAAMPFNELFAKYESLEKKNGAIDKLGFCALVKGMFGADQSALVEAIFDYVDIDSGGSLDGGEVLCMLNLFCSGDANDKLATCFAAFDDDKSGSLSADEFKKMLLYSLSRSRQLLEEVLGAYYPQNLSPDDAIIVTLPKIDEASAARFAVDAFAIADADGSGAIDKAEFLAWASADPMFASFLRTHDKVFGPGATTSLLAELAPPAYAEDIVRLSRAGIDAFVAKTGFKPLAFVDVVAKMTALVDGGAAITKDAFAELLGASFAGGQRELLDALFDFFDGDESGELDPAEVLCCLNSLTYGSKADKLRLCFSAYDDDKSNSLDLQEVGAMLQSALIESRNVLVELIGAFTDNPADVESASTSVALTSLNGREVAQLAERLFAEADADGSGHVDFVEFLAWAQANHLMCDFMNTHGLLFGVRVEDDPDDCAVIAIDGVRSFVEKTKFAPLPFATIFAKFRALPKSDDGALHKADFIALVADLFGGGGAEQQELIEAIFDFLDIDGGGSLSPAETVCALNTFCSGSAVEKAQICFQAFDTDGSGSLDRAEWLHLFVTTLVQSRNLLVELIGAFVDDAAFDLAKAAVVKLHKVSELDAEALADLSFAQVDASGDGSISQDEFVSFAAHNERFVSFFATHDKLFSI
jgi:Ca2+-binding EF-hand superfamily protein